jgi:hypothetical protein
MATLLETITEGKLEKMAKGALRNGEGKPVDRITEGGFPGFTACHSRRVIVFGFHSGGRKYRKWKTIGTWPALSVEEARGKAHEVAARLLSKDRDPAVEVKAEKSPKQTETEAQIVAGLQGIEQVLRQVAADVAALRVSLESRLPGAASPESKCQLRDLSHGSMTNGSSTLLPPDDGVVDRLIVDWYSAPLAVWRPLPADFRAFFAPNRRGPRVH